MQPPTNDHPPRVRCGGKRADASDRRYEREHEARSRRIEPRSAAQFQGQLLRQSERHEAAIFLRDGTLWVADFIDGEGTLIDAITWFRFNCGALASPHARRRMVLESAVPLSPDLVAKIGRLCEATEPGAPGRGAGVCWRTALLAVRARIRRAGATIGVFDRALKDGSDPPT